MKEIVLGAVINRDNSLPSFGNVQRYLGGGRYVVTYHGRDAVAGYNGGEVLGKGTDVTLIKQNNVVLIVSVGHRSGASVKKRVISL